MPRQSTRKILQKHGLAAHKRFGQNFLVNQATAAGIVHAAHVHEDDIVIEVGVGLGALTAPLARAAKKVIGVEIDSGLIRYHEEEGQLADNVELLHNDILKVDFSTLRQASKGRQLLIIANLPYSISNPFIFKLIDNREYLDRVVVMLQKEMAERLTAPTSTKAYGIPTVLLGACATTRKLMTVPPQEFHPRPKIDSIVVNIDFRSTPAIQEDWPDFDFSLFQRLVRAAFAQRRKTLSNNIGRSGILSAAVGSDEPKDHIRQVIESAGLSPQCRAETLTISDFIRLTRTISAMI